MNRIVLIGNGFDLAHGLKTSYADFIYWYWKKRILSLYYEKSNMSDDGLCKLEIPNGNSWSLYVVNNLISLKGSSGKEIYHNLKAHHALFQMAYSPFFKRIHNSIETKKWVDIENEYYALLFQKKMDLKKGLIEPDYKAINDQLDIVRGKLIEYLQQVEKEEVNAIGEVETKIYCPFKKRELAVSYKLCGNGRSNEELKPARIMLLNFNYTTTPTLYTPKHSHVSINFIHGCLDKIESVIFGYGDELDEGFKELKDSNNNECLRHMKSIRYLESNNYRKLLEFIESVPFQVCIMGHSCGNSDRTLLNTLFEHRNCVSIKPYYYINDEGKDNYIDIVQNISRNFNDMKLMRDRVVNKLYCEPLTKKDSQESDQ